MGGHVDHLLAEATLRFATLVLRAACLHSLTAFATVDLATGGCADLLLLVALLKLLFDSFLTTAGHVITTLMNTA